MVEAAAAAAALALENERRLVALAKTQARIQALVDAFPDLIFRMSRDGVYLEYKGKPEDLAVPPEQLLGARFHDVLPTDVADQLLAGVVRAIDTGEIVTGDYTLELDGVPRDFEARIVKAGDEAVADRPRVHRAEPRAGRARTAARRAPAAPSRSRARARLRHHRRRLDAEPALPDHAGRLHRALQHLAGTAVRTAGRRPDPWECVLGRFHRSGGARRSEGRPRGRDGRRWAPRVRERLDHGNRGAPASDLVDDAASGRQG